MTRPLTIARVLNNFLYGQDDTPEDIFDRVRDGNNDPGPKILLDTFSYMAGVGRFASAFQAAAVSRFFAGDFNLDAFAPDANGVRSATLAQIEGADLISDTEETVVISHYSTGIGEADYEYRAFVFGLTEFRLSRHAVFTDDNGMLSIRGATLLPSEDNFDLESNNPYAQWVNENILRPVVDPYSIGRKIFFNFDDSNVAFEADHANDIITSADAPTILEQAYSSITEALSFIAASDYYDSAVAVVPELIQNLQYVLNDKNIIYGNQSSNRVDADYVEADEVLGLHTHYNPDSPSYYITGGGDDVITTLGSASDVVHAGSGRDIVDARQTMWAEVHGGLDNDLLLLGEGATGHGDEGNDRIVFAAGEGGTAYGGAGDDHIFVDRAGGFSIDAGDGNDAVVLLPNPEGDDDAYVDVTLGAGTDTLYILADDSFSYWDDSRRVTVLDGSAGDRIVFNGRALTGGEYTVFKEVTSSEVFDGDAAFFDDDGGVIYHLYDDVLDILLPDMTRMTIRNYQAGDFGITLTGFEDYWAGREWVTLEDNGWSGLPRAATAGAETISAPATMRPAGSRTRTWRAFRRAMPAGEG